MALGRTLEPNHPWPTLVHPGPTPAGEDRQQQCLCVDICGDGTDNNCNCVVDECVQEICDDGIDNDGDGLADGADPSCIIVD